MSQIHVKENSKRIWIMHVGNNSRLIIIPMQMPIFIQITWRLGFTFRSACLASYYLFIYLFTLYNPNGLYSNTNWFNILSTV